MVSRSGEEGYEDLLHMLRLHHLVQQVGEARQLEQGLPRRRGKDWQQGGENIVREVLQYQARCLCRPHNQPGNLLPPAACQSCPSALELDKLWAQDSCLLALLQLGK